MKTCFILSVTLVLIFSMQSHAQNHSNSITNATIKYKIIRTSMQIVDSGNVVLPKTLVKASLSKSLRSEVARYSYEDWMKLLSSERSDWAANLVLYDLFQRDAMALFSINKRSEWVRKQKDTDIEFWTNKLKERYESPHN